MENEKLEMIEVNYKNKKRYNCAKMPIRQSRFFTWLIYVLSKIMLIGKKVKIEKINMEGVKPPYLMLSNHMYFIDFELAAVALYPHRMNNIVSIDGYYRRPWLMELIGCMTTRKFTPDLNLVKSMLRCFKRGDAVGLYPEARYTAQGAKSFIPESVAKMVKLGKVPVVTVIHHGNHLHTPFWNWRDKRKVPFYTVVKQILTPEQIKNMSVEEINEVIQKEMEYNEYDYQKENNILIKKKTRAEGLNKILYQCPHCKKEGKMYTKGHELYCEECGKRWNFNEDGTLEAQDGNTEFTKVTDWYEWERSEVRKQVRSGEYHFEDEVEVYGFPRCYKFFKLGKAKVRHTIEEGFVLEGHYRGEDYRILKRPIEANSLHLEYEWCYVKPYDCFDISIERDSLFCYPTKRDVITKLGFATEELYQLHLERVRNG